MRHPSKFTLLALALLLPSSIASAADPLPPKERFHLFLLVGQSNMAGRGKVGTEDQAPHPRVLCFDQNQAWVPAVAPLHFDKPRVVGVGLGRSFGMAVAEAAPGVTVGLIPCAAGGSPISSWSPGGYHSQTKSHPYDDALARARAALQVGTLKGILWHQGESDSRPERSAVYEEKLHELIARLRRDLKAADVPFLAGQLGQFPARPWNDARREVDAAHRNLPQKIPATAFVPSHGLTHKGDEVHFDAASYRELGRRYASAYLSLASAEPSDAGQPLQRILFGSCIKQDRPVPIFDQILARNPELFIFLGDNIYADTEDMKVMQHKYQQLADMSGFRALREQCPLLATWDDHDYGANDSGSDYPQREESKTLFLKFWGDSPEAARRFRPGVFASHTFGPPGRRIQILLLDTRYFRGPLKKGERRVGGSYLPTEDPSVPLLGEEQWRWLNRQLRQPADLRILATSIQCLPTDAGQECWSNLPHERTRLLELIRETQAEGLILISGDRHWSELSRVSEDLPYPLFELTSSSLNQPHPRGTPTENKNRADATTYHQANFGELVMDWEADEPTVSLRIIDAEGKVRIERVLSMVDLRP